MALARDRSDAQPLLMLPLYMLQLIFFKLKLWMLIIFLNMLHAYRREYSSYDTILVHTHTITLDFTWCPVLLYNPPYVFIYIYKYICPIGWPMQFVVHHSSQFVSWTLAAPTLFSTEVIKFRMVGNRALESSLLL